MFVILMIFGVGAVDSMSPPMRLPTCELERERMISVPPSPGKHVPECDEYGDFKLQQCDYSTNRCWCVNTQTGVKIDAVLPSCRPLTKCERASTKGIPGGHTPTCDANGDYELKQCDDSSNECWCVNTNTGDVIDAVLPSCRPPTNCELASREMTPGGFTPRCDQDGNYIPLQCNASTGQCYCISKFGKIDENSFTGPGEQPPTCSLGAAPP